MGRGEWGGEGQIDPPHPEKTTLKKPSLRVKTKRPKSYNTEVSIMIKRPKSYTTEVLSEHFSYHGKLILKRIC